MEVYAVYSTVTFEFPHGKMPLSLGNCVFLSFLLFLILSLFLSLSCLWLNIFETKYRQKLSHIRKKQSIVRKKGWCWWYRSFDDRSRKCVRARQAERREVVRRGWWCIVRAAQPNWNVTILWKTGTHRRTQYPISLYSEYRSIDRKEFFDIEDRGIQSCAKTKRK